ncbi:uncharacterized protein LOC108674077 [Hyalella azteca]|uniref:Uncharacterized protein LOC108674077 n=1 Tax=Hyalella azteca TaxID=294128 RepID=A0A8B7NX54_HYAAZ|nr:uncharacterized protein LOC108674077 [Hyalella azteca]
MEVDEHSSSSSGEISDIQDESEEISSPPSIAPSFKGSKKKNTIEMSRTKSQLTPRMALYIPPHLQKQTQPSLNTPKKAVVKSATVQTPQQIKQQQKLRAKLEEFTKSYARKQFQQLRNKTTRQTIHKASSKKCNKTNLPAEAWTNEMQSLLETKTKCILKFQETGCTSSLRESRKAKNSLRKLLRKLRSKAVVSQNIYHNLNIFHSKFSSSKSPDRIRCVDDYPCLDEDVDIERDRFIPSKIQLIYAQNEWAEDIISYTAKITSKKTSLTDVVKVEIIDSDEEVQSSAAGERSVGGGARRAVGSAPDSSPMDSSNNEYLNQQFLRRQHDYEREQKYKQISTEARTRRPSRETFEDSLREYCQSGNLKLNLDSSRRSSLVHARSPEPLRPPFFPMNPAFSNHGFPGPPEDVPREPFVKERRLKIYSPPKEIFPSLIHDDAFISRRHFIHETGNNKLNDGRGVNFNEKSRKDLGDRAVFARNYSHNGIEEYPVVGLNSHDCRKEASHERSNSHSYRLESPERREASTRANHLSREKAVREVRRKEAQRERSSSSTAERGYRSNGFQPNYRDSRESDADEHSFRNYVSYPQRKDDREHSRHSHDTEDLHFSSYPNGLTDGRGSLRHLKHESAGHGKQDRRENYSPSVMHSRKAVQDADRSGKREWHDNDRSDRREWHDNDRSDRREWHDNDRRFQRDSRMDYHIHAETQDRFSNRNRRTSADREHPFNLLKHDIDRVKSRNSESPGREAYDRCFSKRKCNEREDAMRSAKRKKRQE